jgi:hypothetical protein
MRLSLKESKAVADLAELLYPFLPGSGNPAWKGHMSFRTVAQSVGVGSFWQSGSKIPMITALLTRTLESRRDRFEALILEVVRAGIIYRQKQGNPVKPAEIDTLNGLVLEVGFKFSDLWDPAFKASLGAKGAKRAEEQISRTLQQEKIRISQVEERQTRLASLRDLFFKLSTQEDRQDAGRQFEKVLNQLFELHDLKPREPFSVVGEEIDGSFKLDSETYLVEAKWEATPLPEGPLLIFRGKVEGKSTFTRGVFIALNGITGEARDAITRGKQPNFFLFDGHDISMVLADEADLKELLRVRRRILAEEGRVVVPFSEAWSRR